MLYENRFKNPEDVPVILEKIRQLAGRTIASCDFRRQFYLPRDILLHNRRQDPICGVLPVRRIVFKTYAANLPFFSKLFYCAANVRGVAVRRKDAVEGELLVDGMQEPREPGRIIFGFYKGKVN